MPNSAKSILEPKSLNQETDYRTHLTDGEQTFLNEMQPVMNSLKSGSLHEVEMWVYEHRQQLGRNAINDITFEIARIRYIHLLQKPFSCERLQQLLQFAQQHLSLFYGKFENEIQALLQILLTYGQSSECNITTQKDTRSSCIESVEFYVTRLRDKVIQHCAKINGLPGDGLCSNFEILLNAGKNATPVVTAALQFVKPSYKRSGSDSDEHDVTLFDLEASGLPLDFKLKSEQRYHSVFSCPVSRQSASDSDPPVLLKCGHAILMSSMKSLPRRNLKFKCPTCYGPSEESEVIPLVI